MSVSVLAPLFTLALELQGLLYEISVKCVVVHVFLWCNIPNSFYKLFNIFTLITFDPRDQRAHLSIGNRNLLSVLE